MPVNQIYRPEESKALMVRLDLDVQIAPNVTQKVHTGWLSPPDDMLLREKMDDGATVAQSSQVLKTFVYREHLVVHTSIPFDRWCQGDCGCVEKGYYNVQAHDRRLDQLPAAGRAHRHHRHPPDLSGRRLSLRDRCAASAAPRCSRRAARAHDVASRVRVLATAVASGPGGEGKGELQF